MDSDPSTRRVSVTVVWRKNTLGNPDGFGGATTGTTDGLVGWRLGSHRGHRDHKQEQLRLLASRLRLFRLGTVLFVRLHGTVLVRRWKLLLQRAGRECNPFVNEHRVADHNHDRHPARRKL
jgi:hypothetical protein